jgi:raffinose/stachyose/melibiose transport system permease protein
MEDKKNHKTKNHIINIYYIPALLLFCIFVIYPLIKGLEISFTNWNGFSQNQKYVGLRNYKTFLTDPKILISLRNTIIYGFGSTIMQNFIGLAYALFLNKIFLGRNITRVIIYLQAMVAPLIMGYMYYFILQYDGGALNDLVKILGMESIDWLSKGETAILLMIFINTFQFVGVSMIIYLAGLQGIPTSYYEAAEMDGAGSWEKFHSITLPLLTPAITSSVMLNLIGGLKLFDIIIALTNGGPGFATHSLATLVSYTYFRGQNAGYSSTIGIFTFLLIMAISILVMSFFNRKEVEQ